MPRTNERLNGTIIHLIGLCTLISVLGTDCPCADDDLAPISYGDSNLAVDLGVGLWAWPMPIDWDRDGDLDLLVGCPCKPYNGLFLFENPSPRGSRDKHPVFRPAVRVSAGFDNIQISYFQNEPRILVPGREFVDFRANHFESQRSIYPQSMVYTPQGKIRANQWKISDYDGDGLGDLIVGVGDWTDYGWDDAFNAQGAWTRGPLHGWVFQLRNLGSNAQPKFGEPEKLVAGGAAVDVFGRPSPNLEDFDGDGDLDLLCGEFLDGFTYFQNTGTRNKPIYAAGRRLTHQNKPLVMELQMIVPSAIDWDADGDIDLVVGDEDGRVALVEHTGKIEDGLPVFLPPVYFRQKAADVKCGALATPVGVDWDEDGDDDIISGNTAGVIEFFENQSGPRVAKPKWGPPRRLTANGQMIRIQAGPNGSIQGPCEAKWGYTTLSVADWDHDGLRDLIVNSIWGKVHWYRNIGSRGSPKLDQERPIDVQWPEGTTPPKPAWNWWSPSGNELVTQWRTTPVVTDWTSDGRNDLIMLDHEGYLCLFERRLGTRGLELQPPRRAFVDAKGDPLQLNPGRAGKSGRRKLTVVDWDGDGRLDLLLNSVNVDWLRNVETRGSQYVLVNQGPLGQRDLNAHDTSPTTVDWDGDGIRDLLLGAEDGFMYWLRNPRSQRR